MKRINLAVVIFLSLFGFSISPAFAAATCAQRINNAEARLAKYRDSEKKTGAMEQLNEAKTARDAKNNDECIENVRKVENYLKQKK